LIDEGKAWMKAAPATLGMREVAKTRTKELEEQNE
jgi:hypothetical protein